MNKKHSFFIDFSDRFSTRSKRGKGQGLVEYALILAAIAMVAIVVLVVVGGKTSNVFSNVSGTLGGTSSAPKGPTNPEVTQVDGPYSGGYETLANSTTATPLILCDALFPPLTDTSYNRIGGAETLAYLVPPTNNPSNATLLKGGSTY